MRTIQKKISLEQFKSRMPSIIPAYDSNGKKHNFTHFIDLLDKPVVNYGMLPVDIQVDEKTELGHYSGKMFSYHKLSEIYHKIDTYYNKPFTKNCCEPTYISDEDKEFYKWLSQKCFPFFVFDIELENVSNLNDIKEYWKCNRLSIKEVSKWYKKMCSLYADKNTDCCIEEEYEKRGGDNMKNSLIYWYNKCINMIVCDKSDYGKSFTYKVNESDNKVKVKVVKKQKNGIWVVSTHEFSIFEPRVRVLGNNRFITYGKIDENNNIISPQNIEIIDNILTIPNLFSSTDSVLIISEPYMNIPLLLTNSMENIGEMMSICEDWDGGFEYNQNILNQDIIDYSGGPMVYYNGDNWILKSYENPGYIYSQTYQEVYFGAVDGMTNTEFEYFNDNEMEFQNIHNTNPQWERYFNYLPSTNDLNLNNYAYKNNQIVLTPNPYIMGDKYEIEVNNGYGFTLYKDSLYPNISCDYIEYKGQYYEVFYVYKDMGEKRNPYIIINGMTVYINKPNCSPNNQFQFEIKIRPNYGHNMIRYDGKLKMIDNSLSIDGYVKHNGNEIHFKKINGVFSAMTNSIGTFIEKNNLPSQNANFKGYTTYQEDNKWYTIISQPFTIYNGEKISGETTSKLNDVLNDLYWAIDNLGNKFEGLMPYKTISYKGENDTTQSYKDYVVNPSFNDWLSIPYMPKQVNNLDEISENIYWGNIINKVTFVYTDNNIKHNIECTEISTLRTQEEKLRDLNDNVEIYCLVEYYMGTIIEKNGSNYSLKLNNENDYYGVKYIDTITLSRQQCLYYYDEMDTCILNYWKLTPTTKVYDNSTYNVKRLVEPIANFEFKIKPFELQYGYKLYYDDNSFKFYKVNEFDEYVKYGNTNTEYLIEINANKKYFSIPLLNVENQKLYSVYDYYCLLNGVKYYAQYVNESNTKYFKIIINDDITYKSNGLTNVWDDDGTPIDVEIFCQIPIKLYLRKLQNTEDTYFDYMNDMTASPLIFNENKIGQATQKNITDNIYIDRGTVRAMDYHLRLLEAKSLESLEQIGNGFFKFNSNNGIK